jgi:hypothetical protein
MPGHRNSDAKLDDIAGEVLVETPGAYRFYDGKTTDWLPKSQVEWDADDGIMTMPHWLAKEKGFI